MHASLFSSVKHRTHGLAGDESPVWLFSSVVEVNDLPICVCSCLLVTVDCGTDPVEDIDSLVLKCTGVVISTSQLIVELTTVVWLGAEGGALPACSRRIASVNNKNRDL